MCNVTESNPNPKILQDQLIPNSAWKDYSSNTNYAFDAFNENEHHQQKPTAKPRGRSSAGNGASQQTTLQMTATPTKAPGYYDNGRNGRQHQNADGQR